MANATNISKHATKEVSKNNTVRLTDIAEAVGVSRAAVARVLLGTGKGRVRLGATTQEKILRMAKQLNYRPNAIARQLAGKKSHVIGVIVDSCAAAVQFSRLSMLENEASRRGYRFIVGQAHDDINRLGDYIKDFAARGLDGVICMSHFYPGKTDNLEAILGGVPNIVFVGEPSFSCQHKVCIDTAAGIRKSVQHLLDCGRQRIGLVLMGSGYPTMQHRRTGYIQQLQLQGRVVEEKYIWTTDSVPNPISDLTDIIDNIIEQLVKTQKVDAIQANNDNIAVRLIKRLKHYGYRIPDDIAIVGYDNLEIGQFCEPELTTIDQNNTVLVNRVIGMLFDLIETRQPDVSYMQPVLPNLIIRSST